MPGWRVVAVDDSPLTGKRVRCIGVIARTGCTPPEAGVEGVLSFFVERDGFDATRALVRAVKHSRWAKQLALVLVHTICLAGFNIIDVPRLHRALRAPIACITRRAPDEAAVEAALRALPHARRRLALVRRAGALRRSPWSYHYYARGRVEPLLKCFVGYPWPLRLAHMIASGVARGASGGRA